MIQTIMLWINVLYAVVLGIYVCTYVIIQKRFPHFNFNEIVGFVAMGWFIYIFSTMTNPWLYFFIGLGISIIYSVIILVLWIAGKISSDIIIPWYVRDENL